MSSGGRKFTWYKRSPSAFIAATVGWRWELKCVYGIVLDLIYDGGGSCADDPSWIANIIGVGMTVRRWNVLRTELIERQKLFARNGRLFNPRATQVIGNIQSGSDLEGDNRPEKTEIIGSKKQRLSSGPTSSPRGLEPRKNEDNRLEKIGETINSLFEGNGLDGFTTDLTRARADRIEIESESDDPINRSKLSPAEVIQHVEQLASYLGQERGRYWEQDFRNMIENDGLDPKDIIEAARSHTGGKLKSLNWLRGLAKKKRDDRMARPRARDEITVTTPAPPVDVDGWKTALVLLAHRGAWLEATLGPMPGTGGYRGPTDLEQQFLSGWRAQGSHPLEELDASDNLVPYPAEKPDPERRARWSKIV